MKKCKSCGKIEWGYATLLNEDGYCWKCASKHIGEKYQRILDFSAELEIKTNILRDKIITTEKRIADLERIVNNQPLIKKYQKTLDIFMKNAQD